MTFWEIDDGDTACKSNAVLFTMHAGTVAPTERQRRGGTDISLVSSHLSSIVMVLLVCMHCLTVSPRALPLTGGEQFARCERELTSAIDLGSSSSMGWDMGSRSEADVRRI